MKAVYIAHALSGPDREANIARAARWMVWAARQGVCPMGSWIVLAAAWDETAENRRVGLALDCAQIERCDALWLCGAEVSPGMQYEADHARAFGIPVIGCLSYDGEPPP